MVVTRLDRYIFMKMLTLFVMSVFVFSGLYIVIDLFDIIEYLGKQSASESVRLAVEYYANIMPGVISDVLPFIALTSSTITIAILARNKELAILKACGVNLFRVFLPVVVFGLLLGVLDARVRRSVLPQSIPNAEELRPVLKAKKNREQAKVRTITSLEVIRNGFHVYEIKQLHPWENWAEQITLSIMDAQGRLEQIIRAKRGAWGQDEGWLLEDVRIMVRDPRTKHLGIPTYHASYVFKEGLSPARLMRSQKDFREMTKEELRHFPRFVRPVRIEQAKRDWVPYAGLILILIGTPLILRRKWEGHFFMAGACALAICAGYFLVLFCFIRLGQVGVLGPEISVAIPHVVFAAGGILGLLRMPR